MAASIGRKRRRLALATALAAVLAGSAQLSPARAAGPTFTSIAPLPVPRTGPGITAGRDGDIYTVAGLNWGSSIWEVDEYDPGTNTWTSRAHYPEARSNLAVATGSDGTIYGMGGMGWNPQVSAAMYAYNPASDTWTERAPLPLGRFGLAAATGPDGHIYAIGGTYFTNIPKLYNGKPPTVKQTAEVDAYDPHTNRWTKVKSLPKAYGYPSATTGADGRIYVVEGCTAKACAGPPYKPATGSMAPQLLAYDVHTTHWTQLAAPPLAKSWPSITTGADGRIYVVGPGLYASKDNSAEVYDPAINSWSVLPSLALADPGAAVATGADGRVYVVGGSDPNTGKTVTDVRTFPS
jgi:N-acetylneuraminic acid mutarotase